MPIQKKIVGPKKVVDCFRGTPYSLLIDGGGGRGEADEKMAKQATITWAEMTRIENEMMTGLDGDRRTAVVTLAGQLVEGLSGIVAAGDYRAALGFARDKIAIEW